MRACLRLSSRHWISEKMMMTVGKKMIVRNIAFVTFTSLVSPNQPSPAWEVASADGAKLNAATPTVTSAEMILARRMCG